MGKVYQRAVMRCPGIIFPTPYPQGYGATPPLPRPPQSACDVPGSMPEAAPYGNAGCLVHRACVSSRPHSVTSGRAPPVTRRRRGVTAPRAPHRRTAPGSTAAERCREATPRRCSAVHRHRSPAWRSAHPPPRPPVHPPTGYRHPSGSCRPTRGLPDPRPARPAAGAYGRSRSLGVVRRSNDGFRLAQPYIFSQLLTPAHSLRIWPINPLATRQEETRRYASTRRGRATNARRTSLHGF